MHQKYANETKKSEKFCYTVTYVKILFSRLLFFPYSQQLEEPRKIGFGGVPLKQHIEENARKLVKTSANRALDFFAHAHINKDFLSYCI